MSYVSKKPCWVPLLSAKYRKLKQQCTQNHQNWIVEEAWSNESRFLLRHRWYCQAFAPTAWIHGPNLPCVNIPSWWRWCNGVGTVFSACLEPLNTNHQLYTTVYLRTMCFPSGTQFIHFILAISRMIRHQLTKLRWFHNHALHWPSQLPILRQIGHIWDAVKWKLYIMRAWNLQELHDVFRFPMTNLVGMFPTSYGTNAMNSLGCFESKGSTQY